MDNIYLFAALVGLVCIGLFKIFGFWGTFKLSLVTLGFIVYGWELFLPLLGMWACINALGSLVMQWLLLKDIRGGKTQHSRATHALLMPYLAFRGIMNGDWSYTPYTSWYGRAWSCFAAFVVIMPNWFMWLHATSRTGMWEEQPRTTFAV